MKRLIFVNGPMGVGKSAVCSELKRMLAPCAFLDGDWCWDLTPFSVTEETKAMVLGIATDNLSAADVARQIAGILLGKERI